MEQLDAKHDRQYQIKKQLAASEGDPESVGKPPHHLVPTASTPEEGGGQQAGLRQRKAGGVEEDTTYINVAMDTLSCGSGPRGEPKSSVTVRQKDKTDTVAPTE